MVHSFGSTAPPFTTHSTAFEATLTQQMGKRVDLDEVSLDMARYAQPDMEEPFVEFLLKRLAKWHPDLVVPVGSPAGRFVAKYRTRLFPILLSSIPGWTCGRSARDLRQRHLRRRKLQPHWPGRGHSPVGA